MSTLTEITELLTAIAISVAIALVISTLFILALVWKKNKELYKNYIRRLVLRRGGSPEVMMLKPAVVDEMPEEHSETEMLATDGLEDEVAELIPHCLAVLKICRSLTERLTALSIGMLNTDGNGLRQIVDCARKISMRVDQMVGSMYPPVNPQLLEARAASLMLAVTQLAVIAQYECHSKRIPMEWIQEALQEMEAHITVIRESAVPSYSTTVCVDSEITCS